MFIPKSGLCRQPSRIQSFAYNSGSREGRESRVFTDWCNPKKNSFDQMQACMSPSADAIQSICVVRTLLDFDSTIAEKYIVYVGLECDDVVIMLGANGDG